jgi:hypothetical protein
MAWAAYPSHGTDSCAVFLLRHFKLFKLDTLDTLNYGS